EMQEVYCDMHKRGFAHSVECWQKGELVGGLYGVYIEGVFSGESMFHLQTGASKQCVVALVEQLHKMGHEWFDIQMVTPVLETFGGSYVNRKDYLLLLKTAQIKKRPWGVS
ncbi:leucyl/phenylalanyl-tRNA--protein transferase, partial [bacterium]|nr:leucyl/phenylalanyl-tRNA--protein transferase [bacterium]